MYMIPHTATPLLFVAKPSSEHQQLADFLSQSGCTVTWVHRRSEALSILDRFDTGAVLLDAGESPIASLELCYSIKSGQSHRNLRVLILGASGESREEIAAFDAGADDFIRRPLDPEAVYKRVRARMELPNGGRSRFTNPNNDHLIIDREAYAVYLNQEAIPVSRKEFELLHLMAAQPGKVFTRDEIFEKVWKRKPSANDRTIDVHILRLRRKLGPAFITTQKGVGYRFMQA